MVSLPFVAAGREAPKSGAKTSSSFLRTYATAMTAVLFLVAAVTGVLMFFHVGGHTLTGMHEWLGMVFVAAALLHVVRNRGGFVKLAKAPRTWVLAGLVAIAAAGFLNAAQSQEGGSPVTALVRATGSAPLSALAPALNLPVEEMIARLEKAGIAVAGPDQSLKAMAATQGADTFQLLSVVLRKDESPR